MSNLKGSAQAASRREHNLEKEAKRVQMVDAFGGVITSGNMTTYIEDLGGGTVYVGYAQIGTATSAAGWQIMKVSEVAGVTSITWADATDEFIKVWNNRASYTYS